MDDIAEALLGLRDCNSVNDAPEENLFDKVASVSPKLDAVSKVIASEVNTDTTEKKKRKKIKKKVNVVNEIQSMHQMEMNTGSTEEIMAPTNGNLGASDNVSEAVSNLEIAEQPNLDAVPNENGSEVNIGTAKKEKRKKKVNVNDEIRCMHHIEMNMGITEDLVEVKAPANGNLGASDDISDYHVVTNEPEDSLPGKDVPKLEMVEQPRLDLVPKEIDSEGNTDTKKKKKRKKKVDVSSEIQCMHKTEKNMGSTKNLVGIKAQMSDNVGSSDNTSDYHVDNNEPEKNLPDKDVPILKLSEQLKLDAMSNEKAPECSMDITKKKRRKKKETAINEIQCMDETVKNMGSTENLMGIKAQINDNLGVADNKSDYHVADDEPEKNFPSKDVPMLEPSEQPKLDDVSKENAYDMDTTKKKKRKKKVTVINEAQCMDQTGMDMGSTENHMEIKAQVNDNLGATDNTSDYHIINNEPEKNLPSKDIPMLELSEQPKLDVSKENASDTDTTKKKKLKKKATVITETQCMDQTGMNMGSTDNHMEIKAQMSDDLGASNNTSDYHVVKNEPEKNLPDKYLPMLELSEQPKLEVSKENASECGTDMTKKKKRKKKVNVVNENHTNEDMHQTEMNEGTTGNHMEINSSDNTSDCHVVNNEPEKNLPDKDVPTLEPVKHHELDASLVVDASEETTGTKKKKKPKKKVNVLNEVQNMEQTLMNAVTMENVTEIIDHRNGTLEASNDVRDCYAVNEELEMNRVDKVLTTLPLNEHSNLGPASTANPSENTDTKKKKKRKGKKANVMNGVPIMDQGITENIAEMKDEMDCTVVNSESERNLINGTVLPLSEHTKLDAVSTESALEGNTETKKRKRPKSKSKKVKVMNEVQSITQMEMNTGTSENLAAFKYQIEDHVEPADKIRDCGMVNNESENKFLDLPFVAENPRLDASSIKDASEGNTDKTNEVPTMDKNEMNTGPTDSHAQRKVNKKREWISKKTKRSIARRKNEMEKMNPSDAMYKILLPDEDPVDAMFKILLPDPPTYLVHEEKHLYSRKPEETVLSLNVVGSSSNKVSSESVIERSCHPSMPTKRQGNPVPCESQHKHHLNQVTEENDELENGINEVKNEKCLSEGLGKLPKIVSVNPIRRKLLVLDVNGLLADIVMPAPKDCRGDIHILRRAIFKRPFCDDFLNFCFQNFDVGIWSSRSKVIIDRIVDYLLGNLKDKLLFCWNMSHATQTGSKTLDDVHKPLVCKELRKIWENFEGYDESNTLLLDDSPYKALLNPLHTAIFPSSFHYEDKNDNSLGPGGDLRVYLEGLLTSDNVQSYVEQNPFGQDAINEMDPSWEFYSGVLQTITNRSQSRRRTGGRLEFVSLTNKRN